VGNIFRERRSAGFTIVELATVISVIVILAAIIFVAYPAYLQTTRDNARKSDLQEIASALNAYAIKNNSFVNSASTDGSGNGCGRSSSGNGWFDEGPDANYPASISTCLKNAGVFTKNIVDPTGCVYDGVGSCWGSSGVTAYMKATCTKNSVPVTYVLAYLETQQSRNTEIDALCDNGSVAGFTSSTQKWGTNYGMNYYVTVK
jgi:type II secretory pathway pseudopilin PulG